MALSLFFYVEQDDDKAGAVNQFARRWYSLQGLAVDEAIETIDPLESQLLFWRLRRLVRFLEGKSRGWVENDATAV